METELPMWQWSAHATAKAIRSRKVTCREVMTAHVQRLREVNASVNAVVVDLGDQALLEADAADEALFRGEAPGILHGVPVTVKNNTAVKGYPTTDGVCAYTDRIAGEDAGVVSILRSAGALILGLTNTSEFSFRAFTDNPVAGLTRNPWNGAITCGGSSGGAAVAVAMGIGSIAHGNDRGGSLRWPSHCNGVATIKPTLGKVSSYNPVSEGEPPLMGQIFSQHGPIAREIADVQLGLEAMSLVGANDPWWSPVRDFSEIPFPKRVGVARIPSDMDTDNAIVRHLDLASQYLIDAGYEVREVDIPDLSDVWKLWCDILMTEFATLQEAQALSLGSADFTSAMKSFKSLSSPLDLRGYMQACARRTAHIRTWLTLLEEFPILLTPTSVKRIPGPRADLEGESTLYNILWNDQRFVCAINALGLPAAVVPIGLCDGQPVSVQIVSSPFREDICLQAAAAIEKSAGILAQQLWKIS